MSNNTKYRVKDWWPAGRKWVYWIATSLSSPYLDFNNPNINAQDLAGRVYSVGRVKSEEDCCGSDTIWEYEEIGGEIDIFPQFSLEGHTGAWGYDLGSTTALTVDTIDIYPSGNTLTDSVWYSDTDVVYLKVASEITNG